MRKVYVLIAQMSRSDINKEAGTFSVVGHEGER